MAVEIRGRFAVLAHIFVPDEFAGRRGHVAFLPGLARRDVSARKRKE
jgi:hypothetical protein